MTENVYQLLRHFLCLGFCSWGLYLIINGIKMVFLEKEKTKREKIRHDHELQVINKNQEFKKLQMAHEKEMKNK